MPRFYGVWGGEGKAVQVLFVVAGSAGGRPFVVLGGDICRVSLSPKGFAITHLYTYYDRGLRIKGLPAAAIALGWMLIGQIIWLLEGRFLWPLILMGFVVWWLGDDLVEKEDDDARRKDPGAPTAVEPDH